MTIPVTVEGVAIADQPQAMERKLASLHEAINCGRFEALASMCEALELELAAKGVEVPSDWPYAMHLLGHIFIYDLNGARFLWKRIPEAVKQSQPELVAAWKIGQCVWTYDYAGVHEALRCFTWSPAIQQIVNAIKENYCQKNFKLLSTAYSTISVADAAKVLGLTESETVKNATQNGWVLDPASNMLTVRPVVNLAAQKLDSSKLQDLTEYVFHLEH